MAAAGPITVVSWAEFTADPSLLHGLFAPRPGEYVYNPEMINVLLGDQSSCRRIHVETIEDLVRVKRNFLSKPVAFRVYAEHIKTDNYYFVKLATKWNADMALLLNTRHPRIASVVQNKFEDAERCMQKGEKFCLEFDVGPSLKSWYQDMFEDSWSCSRTRTETKYTRIYVTNHTKYQHCFDFNEIWCVRCTLCWLATAPCYMIHRGMTCVDIHHEFIDIPVVMQAPSGSRHPAEILPAQLLQDSVFVQPVEHSGLVYPAAAPMPDSMMHTAQPEHPQLITFQQPQSVRHSSPAISAQRLASQYTMDTQTGKPVLAHQPDFPTAAQQSRTQSVTGQQPGQHQVAIGQQPMISQQLVQYVTEHDTPDKQTVGIDCETGKHSIA